MGEEDLAVVPVVILAQLFDTHRRREGMKGGSYQIW